MMSNFGNLVKSWRAKHGVSQLELAMRCDVSQKHISFLENGRNRPSLSMVLTLCEGLNIPLRDRNQMLMTAGFAPQYKESSLDAPELEMVDQALNMILQAHEPFPAVVMDGGCNLVRANSGALKMLMFLYDVDHVQNLPEDGANLMHNLFKPDGYRRYVVNWEEVAVKLLRRMQGDVHALGGNDELQELVDELASYRGVPRNWRQVAPGDWEVPMMTIDFEKEGHRLSFFTTLATLGTPQDISLQEIKIESFFPADEATSAFFMNS
ncbi:DNA-binding XRE family transcriptional regulator [Aestuariispira insulae]|uniref:DNA-binding XRE family transcriptional regulator n=2 Tax=Aestuariispira insulae TaxID=1461337 RepID=A0A3D9HSL3_9PROT|nr:DNA-binding XRE family transcriptional regulator [Aestuariispira insulae]